MQLPVCYEHGSFLCVCLPFCYFVNRMEGVSCVVLCMEKDEDLMIAVLAVEFAWYFSPAKVVELQPTVGNLENLSTHYFFPKSPQY